MTIAKPSDGPRRRYRSPLREAQAAALRQSVIRTAVELFEERGWTATSVRDIARRAGVSVETVYSSVGGKAELLRVALDVAVVGDDEPVPLADREEFRLLGVGPVAERALRLGGFLAALHERTARLRQVFNEAARGDEDLAQLNVASQVDEYESYRQGTTFFAGRAVTEREVDAVFAVLGANVYLQLTDLRGWSTEKYQQWVADTIVVLLDLDKE